GYYYCNDIFLRSEVILKSLSRRRRDMKNEHVENYRTVDFPCTRARITTDRSFIACVYQGPKFEYLVICLRSIAHLVRIAGLFVTARSITGSPMPRPPPPAHATGLSRPDLDRCKRARNNAIIRRTVRPDRSDKHVGAGDAHDVTDPPRARPPEYPDADVQRFPKRVTNQINQVIGRGSVPWVTCVVSQPARAPLDDF
ncbi:hypothetical protein EVAR_52434_1, partial [Eumeta japonica]